MTLAFTYLCKRLFIFILFPQLSKFIYNLGIWKIYPEDASGKGYPNDRIIISPKDEHFKCVRGSMGRSAVLRKDNVKEQQSDYRASLEEFHI